MLGRVEVYCEPGGDFVMTPQFDLQLAIDATQQGLATQQWLYRLLTTSPVLKANGIVIARAGDLFNPTWGVGLSRVVGSVDQGSLPSTIQAAITAGVNASSSIASINSLTVSGVSTAGYLTINLSVTTTAGQSVTVPPQQIKVF